MPSQIESVHAFNTLLSSINAPIELELADSLGISPQKLERLLNRPEKISLSVDCVHHLATALGIPLTDLFDNHTREYKSVFISYGGPDEDVARRIYDWLSSFGVKCFFFPVSAKPGVRLHRTMSEGVNDYDRI